MLLCEYFVTIGVTLIRSVVQRIIKLAFFAFPRVHCIDLVLSFLSEPLPNYLQEDYKREKNVICAFAQHYLQPRLDDTAHKQTIICRQLSAGQVVGCWPMKRKKKIALKDNISSLKEHMSSKVGKNLKLNMEGAGFACKLITNMKETSKKDMKNFLSWEG